MPVIPRAERRIDSPSNLNAPIQNLSVSDAAFGGGDAKSLGQAGQSLQRVSNAMTDHVLKLKKDRDDAWVSQSMSKLSTAFDDYSFGENGVYKASGESAVGVTTKAREDLQKYIDEISENSPGQDAAEIFKQRALNLKNSTQHSIARHESSQLQNWKISSGAENALAQSRRISAHWSWEPEKIERDFTDFVVPELEAVAKAKGVPAEKLIRAQREGLYNNIINQNIAAGATGKAEALLEKWSEDIAPENRTALTASIRDKKLNTEAESIANTIIASGAKYTEGHKQIEEIKDADLRKKAKAQYSAVWSDTKRAENLEKQELVNSAIVALESFPTLGEKFTHLNSMPRETPAQRAAYTAAKGAYNHAAKFDGVDPQTDPAAFERLGDKLIDGQRTSDKSLEGDPDWGLIAEPQRKFLKKQLEDSQGFKLLKFRFEQAQGSKYTKEGWLEFLKFAEPRVKETNRGKDEEFLQKLIDYWALNPAGERKDGGWSFGKKGVQSFTGIQDYGENMSLKEAAKKGHLNTWIPKISEIPQEDIAGIRAGFEQYPETRQAFIDAYGSEEAAIRGYYRDNMFNSQRGRN